MEKLNGWVRGLVTLVILSMTLWWLVVVGARLGTPPVMGEGGAVLVDEYARAKDILLVVLPLTTTAFGFWFGVQGKDKAEEKADRAEEKADKAVGESKALIASSTDPELLQRARDTYPEAFGVR